ncbi:MAG: DNA polymerase I, partial [Bacteroidales bacterium]|nr:DNA polymerase I [Bacteroidales bacterium]
MNKRLFLIDAMALIYRGYYALIKRSFITSKGLNTSAILGFFNAFLEILRKEHPSHIGVAFDSQGQTARHLQYAEYKANREKMPEDIKNAIPYIKKLLEALHIPVLYCEGYEADDVIGTLSVKAANADYTVYMVTPDKDFGQLVSPKVFMYKPSRSGSGFSILGENEVCEKFGIKRTEQVIDLLGLQGDASDNIPGVFGVGEMTARKLLEQFDNIENLYEHISEVDNERLRIKLLQNKKSAFESKMLATIILDVPVDFNENDLKMCAPNIPAVKEILDELEMVSFGARLLGYYTEADRAKSILADVRSKMSQKNNNGIDGSTITDKVSTVETGNTRETTSAVTAVFPSTTATDSTPSVKASRIPKTVQRTMPDLFSCIEEQEPPELSGVPESPKSPKSPELPKSPESLEPPELSDPPEPPQQETVSIPDSITFNLKDQLHTLADNGIFIPQQEQKNFFDIRIAAYLLHPETSTKAIIARDAEKLKSLLKKQNLENLFYNIEMPLVWILFEMEREGIKIDKEQLEKFSISLAAQISDVESQIFLYSGHEFNIASPQQLGVVLFDELKVTEKAKKTKVSRQYSTAEDVLVKLENKHPIIPLVLKYRKLVKLKSTYVDALPLLADENSRIHTTYNQTATTTGRLSSVNPNLQNIPIRTELGREIRKAFIADTPDDLLMSADYSQIELRIAAAMSGDPTMLADFVAGYDIHTATAANVFGVPIEQVSNEMRRRAKAINFGILYGMSAHGLSDRLKIPVREAADIIDKYFQKYKALKEFLDGIIAFARHNGYVETLWGRRRYTPDVLSVNGVVRSAAERYAINAPIQGTSADMLKV